AKPGILPPYQERPRTYPLEFQLAFDPRSDGGRWFPLLMTLVPRGEEAAKLLQRMNDQIPEFYRRTEDYYAHFFDTRFTVETPDRDFDRALQWAEIAVDQGKVKLGGEAGLIAGYYESGDSARPGYGWFFGRDSLWTS